MENKEYYTPEIEDLFIGYECERLDGSNIWNPTIIDGMYLHEQQVQLALKEHYKYPVYFRTPYLTKEQIEAEGWKFKGKSVDLWWEKEGTFDMGSFTAYKVVMHYGMKGHIGNQDLKMHIFAEDQGTEYDMFRGEVKSINEFRKITKWLGIE